MKSNNDEGGFFCWLVSFSAPSRLEISVELLSQEDESMLQFET